MAETVMMSDFLVDGETMLAFLFVLWLWGGGNGERDQKCSFRGGGRFFSFSFFALPSLEGRTHSDVRPHFACKAMLEPNKVNLGGSDNFKVTLEKANKDLSYEITSIKGFMSLVVHGLECQ